MSALPDVPSGTDFSAEPISALARRASGRPLEQLIPIGLDGLRTLLESFIHVGFSKFIVRPLAPPEERQTELKELAAGVGDLQT